MIDKKLKNYKLLEVIGTGGMSTVYLGRNIHTGSLAAVKVLKKAYTQDTEHIERFFTREIEITKYLHHKNIVSLLNYGRSGGTYYLIYEYVQGASLDKYLSKHKKIHLKAIESIALQILSALSYAHRQSIVHRDIKPQNILITDSGDVKITDFGIAKALSATTITTTGAFMGSPGYISPEQAEGERIDRRSDLYSFGVLLFEMLSGKLPFKSDTPWGVVNKHIHTPAPNISKIVKGIPPYLSYIVSKCLEKKPSNRFFSAFEIANVINTKSYAEHIVVKPRGSVGEKPEIETVVKPKAEIEKIYKTRKFERFWAWNAIFIFSVLVITVVIVSFYILIISILRNYQSLPIFTYNNYFFNLSLGISLSLGFYIYVIGIIEFFISIRGLSKKLKENYKSSINWLASKILQVFIIVIAVYFFKALINDRMTNSFQTFIFFCIFILLYYYFISSIVYSVNVIRRKKLIYKKEKAAHPYRKKIIVLIISSIVMMITVFIVGNNLNNPSFILGSCEIPQYGNLLIEDNYIYIERNYRATGYSIYIMDINNKNNPYIAGTIETETENEIRIEDIYIDGNYAYIHCQNLGDTYEGSCNVFGCVINVINITDKSNPYIASSIDIKDNKFTRDIYIDGNYIYVSGADKFEIIDINDKNNPYVISSLDSPYFVSELFIEGDYAYIIGEGKKICVINIADKKRPYFRSVIEDESDSSIYLTADGIYIDGNYAYVNYSKFVKSEKDEIFFANGYGISIIDINDKDNPYIISNFESNSETCNRLVDIYINNNYIFIGYNNLNEEYYPTGYGINIIDITNKHNPYIISNFESSSWNIRDIYIDNNFIYLLGDQELHIIDISDKENLKEIKSYDIGQFIFSFNVQEDYIYITVNNRGNSRLEIIDIANMK